jgi:hypothetical protein
MISLLLYLGAIWLDVVTFFAVKDHSNSYTYLFFISMFIFWLISSLQDEYDKIAREVPLKTFADFVGAFSYLLIIAGWASNWPGPSHIIALISIAIGGVISCLSALIALIRKL